MSVPITTGSGSASVAAEVISNQNYQQIKVVDGTASGTTGLKVNSDGSLNVSGSVAATITGSTSVSGTVGASVIGQVPMYVPDTSVLTIITGSQSASVLTSGNGTVGIQVSGSFTGTVSFQATVDGTTWNPTTAVQLSNGTISSSTTGPFAGQVNTAGLAGFRALGNTITVGAASVLLRAGSGVATMMLDNPLPIGTNMIGSVAAIQSNSPWNIAGSVAAIQTGTRITSIVSTVPSSVIVGASIFGLPPVNVTNTNLNVSGSVAAWVNSSNASVISIIPSSVAVAIISGSVAATVTPAANQSVSGTVGASIVGQLPGGNAVLGAVAASISGTPNVAITSIATANGGLSIWSPLGSRIQGTADLRVVQGGSVSAIGAQGAGVRVYVTNVQVSNFGPSSVLVTIADNTTSILGWTIAPAGGGSNYNAFYRGAANSPVTASINGVASVLVSMQGFSSGT